MHHSYLKIIIIVFDIRNKCISPTYSVQLFEFKKESMYLNKRPMGHIAHLIKTVQINKHI